MKKQQTFDTLVSAAARSFQAFGYHATTIEAIALDAGVSAGTVYNYFGTKNAILMAVVTRDTEQALVDAGDAIDLSSGDPVDVLMPLIMTYVDSVTSLGRDLLKEIFRAGFDPEQSSMMAELVSLDKRGLAQIEEAFVLLQTHGLASDTVDAGAASLLVYSVIAVAILMFASMPGSTTRDVERMIRSQVELAFDGVGVRQPLACQGESVTAGENS